MSSLYLMHTNLKYKECSLELAHILAAKLDEKTVALLVSTFVSS
jgi:hypothetical protein